MTIVAMPDGATLNRTTKTTENIRAAIAKDPAVGFEFAVNGLELLTGANKTNAATMFVRLKDWKERETTADQIVDKLKGIGFSQPDGFAFAVNPPAIRGLGTAGGFEVYVQSQIQILQAFCSDEQFDRCIESRTKINRFEYFFPSNCATVANRGRRG